MRERDENQVDALNHFYWKVPYLLLSIFFITTILPLLFYYHNIRILLLQV